MNKLKTLIAILFISFVFYSCKTIITTYDQYSYTQLSTVKVDVLNVMSKATEDYSLHAKEIEVVIAQQHKAMEYDIHKPKNEVMSKMWAILDKLLNDTTSLPTITAGITPHKKGFFASWANEKKLGKAYAENFAQQISEGFDLIMELESSKIKPDNSAINSFLTK
jgi:hypothetical protein